jgi:acetyl esterase/lipase
VTDIQQLPWQPLWPGLEPAAMADGSADIPALRPYVRNGGRPRPCIIVCPGGAYHRLSPHEGEPVARWLAGLGLASAELRYRVRPHRHPVPLNDALRAIRLVRAKAEPWGVDPGRVGVLGFSAGGHLAASAGTLHRQAQLDPHDPIDVQPSRPDAMILCYAVTSAGPNRHQASFDNLVGPDASDTDRQAASPENHVSADTPPAFLWHTADDPAVPVENALLMAGALRKADVPFALHIFPHGRHGLGLADEQPDAAAWTDLCATWLASIGFILP